MEQRSFFELSEHLERLSRIGDPAETLEATIDFEYFRGWLDVGLGYGDGAKGGRPPFDPVSMFKALILQAQYNLSDAKMEFMIRDRLSWISFDLGGPTPDETPIRHFRNRLTQTGTLRRVMKAFDGQLQKKGYIPDVGPDRRRLARAGVQAAQHGRGECGDQSRHVGDGGRAGRAQQGGAEGRQRALDAEDRRQKPVPPDGAPLPQIAVPEIDLPVFR